MHTYVRLCNNIKFYLDDPHKNECVRVSDLVEPIAEICRFNNLLASFYSIAEHSYLVSLETDNPLLGLLHDLSEAVIGDLLSPVKGFCPDYKILENRVDTWIYNCFGLTYTDQEKDNLKYVDLRMLTTEQYAFNRSAEHEYTHPAYTYHSPKCWKPQYAARRFYDRLYYLTNGVFTPDTILQCEKK
jgi:uncharacterized protein